MTATLLRSALGFAQISNEQCCSTDHRQRNVNANSKCCFESAVQKSESQSNSDLSMTKKRDTDLNSLRDLVSKMGGLTTSMTQQVVELLRGEDLESLNTMIGSEEQTLDMMEIDVDNEAVHLMTIHSPVASELRFVLSVMRVSTYLERIGDQTKNICKYLKLMYLHEDSEPHVQMEAMGELVARMVRDAMGAFIQNDAPLAQHVIASDSRVDAIEDLIIAELLERESDSRDSNGSHDVAWMMAQVLICRSLERIGDHATNICEEVLYVVGDRDIARDGG